MSLGEAIATSRQARGLTQAVLAGQLNITQAALSRYEHDLREPTPEILGEIAAALGLTADLLLRTDRMKGALAVGAHMRRRASARATAWRCLEAQLSLYRLHIRRLLDEIEFHVELTLPWFDPFEYEPATAACPLRMQWHIPSGPIHNLTGWMEAAGCLIISMDFGTTRIDGLSQWGDSHPVIMLNSTAPTDRHRLTLAHELGHLCLHSQDVTDDVEADANALPLSFSCLRTPSALNSAI